MNREQLLETIRDSIIGKHHAIDGPFGPRPYHLRRLRGFWEIGDIHRGFHSRARYFRTTRIRTRRALEPGCRRHGFARTRGRLSERQSAEPMKTLSSSPDLVLRERSTSLPTSSTCDYPPTSMIGTTPRPHSLGEETGGVHWSLRAPFQRAAMAGVDRRRRSDRRRRETGDRTGGCSKRLLSATPIDRSGLAASRPLRTSPESVRGRERSPRFSTATGHSPSGTLPPQGRM